MKKDKYYVVTMYRFGDKEKHSYVIGVFNSKHKAIMKSKDEQIYRGNNKYYPEVLEFDINNPFTKKIIVGLPNWEDGN